MQGHVYMDVTQLECEEKTRVAVDCKLEDVGATDKFMLLNSLCQALRISKQEWMCYVLLRDMEM